VTLTAAGREGRARGLGEGAGRGLGERRAGHSPGDAHLELVIHARIQLLPAAHAQTGMAAVHQRQLRAAALCPSEGSSWLHAAAAAAAAATTAVRGVEGELNVEPRAVHVRQVAQQTLEPDHRAHLAGRCQRILC
jgi:hypothetical protein